MFLFDLAWPCSIARLRGTFKKSSKEILGIASKTVMKSTYVCILYSNLCSRSESNPVPPSHLLSTVYFGHINQQFVSASLFYWWLLCTSARSSMLCWVKNPKRQKRNTHTHTPLNGRKSVPSAPRGWSRATKAVIVKWKHQMLRVQCKHGKHVKKRNAFEDSNNKNRHYSYNIFFCLASVVCCRSFALFSFSLPPLPLHVNVFLPFQSFKLE